MICSVLIPSRLRPEKLLRAVGSIVSEAVSGKDFEFLLRFDNDDVSAVNAFLEIGKLHPETRMIVGPRLGYSALDTGYYAALENEARGCFVWIAGDDMVVYGDWLHALRQAPQDRYIIQPETSRLGGSTYHRAEAQAFPIFPKHCWKAYARDFPRPFDTKGDALLKANGWQTHFLEGITFWHDEAPPDELQQHRQSFP